MPIEEQIAVLYCGTHGLMCDLPLAKIADFERMLIRLLEASDNDVLDSLRKGIIDDAASARIEAAAARAVASLKA